MINIYRIQSYERKKSKVAKTKNGRIMLLQKYVVCDCKKLKFIKEQEVRGLLGKLTGTKVPVLSDLPIANNFILKV